MISTKNKIAGVVAGFGLLLSPVAFAADAVNEDTGRNSVNRIEVREENETKINIDNDGDVVNKVSVKTNTGTNKANDNEGDVDISTGDAVADVNVENVVNATKVEVGAEKEVCPPEEDNDNDNDNDDNGVGGGPVDAGGNVVPAVMTEEQGGIGGGVIEAAEEAGGIGGGELPGAGVEGFILPLILSSFVTLVSYLKMRKTPILG